MKKKIVVIGWTLIAILFVVLFIIAAISVLQGEGAQPWKLVRGGRGGSLFPAAVLPVLLAVIVLGFFWLKRRTAKKIQRNTTTNSDE